jgi:hypothetical protein
VVESIDPNVVMQDSIIDNAYIIGWNFKPGCTVHLEKYGEPDIDSIGVGFLDEYSIVANFDFTGAAPGFWDAIRLFIRITLDMAISTAGPICQRTMPVSFTIPVPKPTGNSWAT